MPGILFASHGAESADAAACAAAQLAARRGTTLSAVCVLEPIRIVDGGYAQWYVPTLEEDEAVRASLHLAVTNQLSRCGAVASVQVRTGSPAQEIADAARESNAEVIVLGIGRHDFVERALGNETALQLIQVASTPVLAVPSTMTSLPHRVLAAVDFSPASFASVRTVAQWLVSGDVIHLVYAAGVWPGGFPATERASAESVLHAAARQIHAPHGVKIEQSVVEGDPAAQILEIAAATAADLIAMGSHGYGFWKRLTIGSVASKVIRLSATAVFVTPIGCAASHTPTTAERALRTAPG